MPWVPICGEGFFSYFTVCRCRHPHFPAPHSGATLSCAGLCFLFFILFYCLVWSGIPSRCLFIHCLLYHWGFPVTSPIAFILKTSQYSCHSMFNVSIRSGASQPRALQFILVMQLFSPCLATAVPYRQGTSSPLSLYPHSVGSTTSLCCDNPACVFTCIT